MTQMRHIFKKLLPGQLGNKSDHSSEAVDFELSHKNLKIGLLHFEEGEWVFKYTDEFKVQENLKPIVDFPDKEKEYRSEDLWPFFASRIPSSNSPHIERKIKKNQLDESSIVEMLKAFGQSSISSPFRLTLVL